MKTKFQILFYVYNFPRTRQKGNRKQEIVKIFPPCVVDGGGTGLDGAFVVAGVGTGLEGAFVVAGVVFVAVRVADFVGIAVDGAHVGGVLLHS